MYDDKAASGLSPSGISSLDGGRAAPAAGRPIRVLLAEDHPLMRSSLRAVLEAEADIEVGGVAETLDQLGALVEEHPPDVLVLDLGMSDGPAADLLAGARSEVGATPIVALSMENSRAFAQGALAAGASGHVLKELADIELPPAIRAAVGRASWANPHGTR